MTGLEAFFASICRASGQINKAGLWGQVLQSNKCIIARPDPLIHVTLGFMLAQPVHTQHALLGDGFDGNKMHGGARCRFTNGNGIVGIVLSTLALQPVRGHQMGRDDAGIQAQARQLAGPEVGTGAGFHGHQTTG